MKLGIICSSGGSSIFKALSFFKYKRFKLFIVTDRNCKIIAKCKKKNIFVKKIKYNKNFDEKVKNIFKKKGVKSVLLLFTRLVTSKIYKNFQTFNIHPSWLPKYKGLNALSNQIKKKERFIGATLHIVDSTIDGGKFLFKIKSKYNMKNYKNISYIQKTFLCLLLLCFLSKKTIDLRKINKMFFFKKINCAKIKNNIS
mgnify:CR=1 FL=1|tara:strand:+ start:1350 stop:1943 length:594 start_codon:yes stop_codon:yes gene_type:complete